MNRQIQIRLKILPISLLVNISVIPRLGNTIKYYIMIWEKVNYKAFFKNITLVSKIVKIEPKAYAVFTNYILFIFSELGFWRVVWRKLFAIPETECRKEETLPSAKKKKKSCSSTLQSNSAFIEEAVECLVEEVRKVKEEIEKIRELAFRHTFSLSFIQSFEKGFRGSVCHATPAKLTLLACQACSTLLGCESGTNAWYRSGFDKKCPKCNTPRRLSKTFILKDFDNLVLQLELMNEKTLNSNDSNDTLPVSEE